VTGPAALWFNPAVGVAGDMLLAALVDAGADLDAVRDAVDRLGLPDWSIDTRTVTRGALTATAVTVGAPDRDHHRSWSTIDALLRNADLPVEVRDGARLTFRRLALAEALVHGIDVDDVHFHEVGAIDAVVDVVGAWAALRDLGMPTVTSGPIGLGTGTVEMAHGVVPVPAPATLELLKGAPSIPLDVIGETATPTGVALLVSMSSAWGPPPSGTVVAIGRGAGSWDPPGHANVVTAVAFGTSVVGEDPWPGSTVDATILETNLDDVTPETIGHVIDRALALGADDAWVVPVTMKKSRPGHQLRVLCAPPLVSAVRDLVCRETGTLGVREWCVTKHELDRRTVVVTVDGHAVSVKAGPFGAKPEHDDVLSAASALGRPARDVAADALARFHDPG